MYSVFTSWNRWGTFETLEEARRRAQLIRLRLGECKVWVHDWRGNLVYFVN